MSSPRIETAKAFFAAYGDPTKGSAPHLALRTPDCTHNYAPASVGIPKQDNAAFGAQMDRLAKVLASTEVTPKEFLESESENAVVVWATTVMKYQDAVKDDSIPADEWDYRGEYVFILHMDPSGRKLTRVVEFLDSHNTATKLRKLTGRAMENYQKQQAKA